LFGSFKTNHRILSSTNMLHLSWLSTGVLAS
jgi:hypothetical protein